MALDTKAKRMSMLSFASPLAWQHHFEVDGAVDADDRAHLLHLYGGIPLDTPAETPEPAPTGTGSSGGGVGRIIGIPSKKKKRPDLKIVDVAVPIEAPVEEQQELPAPLSDTQPFGPEPIDFKARASEIFTAREEFDSGELDPNELISKLAQQLVDIQRIMGLQQEIIVRQHAALEEFATKEELSELEDALIALWLANDD